MTNSDDNIIRKVISGEQRAFAELVERHKDRGMTVAVRMLKNHHDAEEALQDAFVRAFRALPSFQGKSSFATWFYRIVYNVCSTMLSKRGSEHFDSLDDQDEEIMVHEISSRDDTPDIQLESEEFHSLIKREIDGMEKDYAIMLTLFYLNNFGYDEIVEITGLPLGTVKNRLFRARTQLRNAVMKKIDVNNEAA